MEDVEIKKQIMILRLETRQHWPKSHSYQNLNMKPSSAQWNKWQDVIFYKSLKWQ